MKIKTRCHDCRAFFEIEIPPSLKGFNLLCPRCIKSLEINSHYEDDTEEDNPFQIRLAPTGRATRNPRYTFRRPVLSENHDITDAYAQAVDGAIRENLIFQANADGVDLDTPTPPNPYLNTTVPGTGDTLTMEDILRARDALNGTRRLS